MDERRPAAFFDLDRTLIETNSGLLYVKWERRAGNITAWQVVRAGVWGLLYHLSLIDITRVYRYALRRFAGVPEATMADQTKRFFDEKVAHLLLPGARAALAQHADRDHPCVVLTSSSPYMAALAAGAWGLEDWLATPFSVDEEALLTGEFEDPICFGVGKVARAEAWAAANGVDLDASWFYTDSYSDLPMLDRVGHPKVVNPDPRLRRHAKTRGWEILDWSAADEKPRALILAE